MMTVSVASRLRRSAWTLILSSAAASLPAATVEITVVDAQGAPMPGVTVSLAELPREAVTGSDGRGRLEDVPAGEYHVLARLSGFLPARRELRVAGEAPAAVGIELAPQVHFSESMTVSPSGRDTFEAYQPTTVLAGEDLQQRLGTTLGETLGSQPGVNVRSFGPAPSRPVIRGLDGDRVLVLENGARTGDLSSQSGDHGVTLDPAAATQIEVVRGPATLLYGSNALGGVVNLISDEIPARSVDGVHGGVTAQGATVNALGGVAGRVVAGNRRWAFRAAGAGHRTGDVDTPAGGIPNSRSQLASGGAGLACTGEQGYAGVSYQYVDMEYGIPFVESGNILLNPRRHRLDARAERRGMGSFFEDVKLQLGYRDYSHAERDGDELGTIFKNKTGEAQLLLNHRPLGKLKGTVGFWGTTRDFEAAGEEALAPPTSQRALAGFLYEELPFHHLTLQFGGRFDRTSFDVDPAAAPEREGLRDRDFSAVSASAGLLAFLREDLTLAVSLTRAARNPSLEELYNFGPHPGNFAFEIGNPGLPAEVGYGVDLSLRHRSRRFNAEATVFRNAVQNFVFAFPTGEQEDELPVVRFASADARLHGLELHADLGLTEALWLEVGADAVRGELTGGGALPRMPPHRGWAGLRYEHGGFHLEGELRAAASQRRTYGLETSTAGYAVVAAHGSYTFPVGRTIHTVTLRLDNAGNRLYRNHLSYIKERAAEAGRSLKVVYGMTF